MDRQSGEVMDFDWKQLVSTVAPTLGTVLLGPLGGGAVKVIADALLGQSTGDPAQDEAQIIAALQGGITPEIRAKLVDAETQVKLAVIAADVRKTEVAADIEKSYLADQANARSIHANTVGILRLGFFINIASYVVIAAVLYGCYRVVTSNFDVDPGVAATVGTLVGATVQWILSNAAQANGFFFGGLPPAGRVEAANIAAGITKAASTTGTKK